LRCSGLWIRKALTALLRARHINYGLRAYSDDPRELGKEATPEEYVSRLVAIFAEVRRVLKPAGTLCLNLGDSYAQSEVRHRQGDSGSTLRNGNCKADEAWAAGTAQTGRRLTHGLPAKNLMMIPARVALALQADGWYLRSDIIWAKGLSGEATRDPDAWCGSVMPESVTDRPTQAHEHIFLLTKSARYWYDHHAVREPSSPDMQRRAAAGHTRGGRGKLDDSRNDHGTFRGEEQKTITGGGRNLRNVLTVSPRGFDGAHFAVFPIELPLTLLPAICPPKVCSECGVAWERRVEKGACDMEAQYERGEPARHGVVGAGASGASNVGGFSGEARDLGFFPACECGTEPVPGTVLDPFGGSGTVAQAARKLNRRSVLIELNREYEAVIRERLGLENGGGLFDEADLGVSFEA
jgi:DNA modification methylase